jgi:hypothetical protein
MIIGIFTDVVKSYPLELTTIIIIVILKDQKISWPLFSKKQYLKKEKTSAYIRVNKIIHKFYKNNLKLTFGSITCMEWALRFID